MEEEEEGGGWRRRCWGGELRSNDRRLQSATGCSPVKTSEAEEQHGTWNCEDAQRIRHGGREATPAVSVQGKHHLCGQILLGLYPPELLAPRHPQELSPLHLARAQDLHVWVRGRGEKKFHHEPRSGEWWNFYLPQLLGHEWGKNCDAHGNWNVPWVMNREFFPSQIPKMIGFTFLLESETLEQSISIKN